MTACVSHKGKIGRVASMALATVLSASCIASTIAPASANDFYYDQQNRSFHDQQAFPSAGSRSIYRDETGRFFIRHGRKQYIQYWDRKSSRDPVVEPRRPRDKTVETAIIAGVAGLAIGAIIAGSQQQRQITPRQVAPVVNTPRHRPLPGHAFPEAPASHQPRIITYEGAFEPWTQSWADWCSRRYRSFNISNGTYKGYDGVSRFCVVN